MTVASCLYEGVVAHRRTQPARDFRHPLTMAYIDLDELPELLGGRLLRSSPGLMRFRRADYHGDAGVALADAVRDTVADLGGGRPAGPIRLLTHLRSLGHCFNPVSFYYCFDQAGRELDAVLLEVTNTPWGERQAYVASASQAEFEKLMHVSPFMPMHQVYSCRLQVPGNELSVVIESGSAGQREFVASLHMRRAELTDRAVRHTVARYPFATIRVLALIYGHALGLKLAGVRSYPHPPRPAP
ncbi:MAG: DUF1365 domain-containing protein [Actinomycetota bacterium]|nr:DUF1365 domain-containing protein [Actinomycetota bacterium]